MEPITLRLTRIDGDYAVLFTADGLEHRIARALLPDAADEGSVLVLENFAYRISD